LERIQAKLIIWSDLRNQWVHHCQVPQTAMLKKSFIQYQQRGKMMSQIPEKGEGVGAAARPTAQNVLTC
jgi:hypothetical protein